MELNVASVN